MRQKFAGIAMIVVLWTTWYAQALPAWPQEAPAIYSIVRNDSTSQVTIEHRKDGQWQQLQIDANKDADITGDQIRVTTNREDHATITVTLPIKGGKKYRLYWNAQSSMWDLTRTVE